MNIKTANRLCELRKKNNLSQEELASKLGVSRQAVSKWERSEASPDTDNLILLAKLYNISLDELVNGEEEAKLASENLESDLNSKVDEEPSIKDGIEELKEELKNNDVLVIEKKDYKAYVNETDIKISYVDGYEKTYNKYDFAKNLKSSKRIVALITGIYTLLTVITYLILGFTLEHGFGTYWFLFILIPFVGSICEAIRKRNPNEFGIALLIVTIYCGICVFTNLWHPLWLLFLIVPVYHIITSFIEDKNHLDVYEIAEKAYFSSLKKEEIVKALD